MSLSRAELEAMSEDELIDELQGLDRRLSDLQVVVFETLKPRLDELEAENDRLRDRVAELEGRVDPNPADQTYAEMSRDERVFSVRVGVASRAAGNGGAGRYEYNDVLSLFDEQPSDGYAYKLLRLAAEADGFRYEKRERENDRLVCDLDAVNDDAVIHSVKNREPNGGA